VHAALWLVLSFFSAAGIWLLLQAEFLAIALVLVYVGAVMVLFLFVVMMLDVNFEVLRQHFKSYLPIAAAVGALVLFEMALVIVDSAIGHTATAGPAPTGSNTVALGKLLYVDYVYPFEIAAVVLLVAIVAAIALTQRGERRHRKHQDPSWQVRVRREDRVRLVDLRSEKPPA
jgi:NADH-quinone oxidoreductase subunit J